MGHQIRHLFGQKAQKALVVLQSTFRVHSHPFEGIRAWECVPSWFVERDVSQQLCGLGTIEA